MRDPRVRLLSLSGELDLSSQRQVHAELSEAAGDRSRELVIDLRGVTFTDSSGLAMIVHTHQQFERQGRSLACVVREGPVQQLLDRDTVLGTWPVAAL